MQGCASGPQAGLAGVRGWSGVAGKHSAALTAFCGALGHRGRIVGITMTGRQIVLPYSEIRIANAFKSGVVLSDEDVIEMQRRVIAENKEWKRRKRRQESTGEAIDESQIERGRKSAERYRRKKQWIRRELTEDERLQLQSAWGS